MKFRERRIDPFATKEDQDTKVKPLSVKGPDIHESLKLAGIKSLKDPKNKKTKLLCCCGVPGCTIGPMTKTQEVQ